MDPLHDPAHQKSKEKYLKIFRSRCDLLEEYSSVNRFFQEAKSVHENGCTILGPGEGDVEKNFFHALEIRTCGSRRLDKLHDLFLDMNRVADTQLLDLRTAEEDVKTAITSLHDMVLKRFRWKKEQLKSLGKSKKLVEKLDYLIQEIENEDWFLEEVSKTHRAGFS